MRKLIALLMPFNVVVAAETAQTPSVVDSTLGVLDTLYGLPGNALVALTCIVLGYVLRLVRKFPNEGIPLACILWGMVCNPLVADPASAGQSIRIWIVRNILVGAIVGAVSWLSHKLILSKLESRIPILGGLLAAADSAADATTRDNPNEP